ncbi:MAG: PqqD family protein [Candidatus Methylomirabilales bacterium]
MALPDGYPRRKDVPWRVIDTEALVVDVKAGLLFPLNSVATRIWECCDGQRTATEIVDAIAAEFDADRPTIARDVGEFLRALHERGLVSLGRAADPLPASDPAPAPTEG